MTKRSNDDTGYGTLRLSVRTVPVPEVASCHQATTVISSSTIRPMPSWPDSSSDCSSESESDSDIEDDAAHRYTLPKDHRFQGQRPEILQLANQRFKEWSVGVKCEDLNGKPSRTSTWRPGSPHLEEEADSSDSELVVVSQPHHPKRRLHLACPCYALDPRVHQSCLLQFNQQSIEGLICHIKSHHPRPFYCPVCREIFDTIIRRDDHILKNTCELRDDTEPIDGIDQYQIARLKRRDKRCRGEARRWHCIWRSLFPYAGLPRSPYLDQGCGLAVSMARDFWEVHGRRCVAEFLESRDMLRGKDDGRAQDALCELALEDLLGEIIGEYGSAMES
ncbi:hypothetical protein ACJZ2D_007158 [Fusarium nematophilum]